MHFDDEMEEKNKVLDMTKKVKEEMDVRDFIIEIDKENGDRIKNHFPATVTRKLSKKKVEKIDGVAIPEACYLCITNNQEGTFIGIRQESKSKRIVYDGLVYNSKIRKIEITKENQELEFRTNNPAKLNLETISILNADDLLVIIFLDNTVKFFHILEKEANAAKARATNSLAIQLDLILDAILFRNELKKSDYFDLRGSDGIYELSAIFQSKVLKRIPFRVESNSKSGRGKIIYLL